MTLRVVEGFDWLPTTADEATLIPLLGSAQYYQAGTWFDPDSMASWEVSDVTAFNYGKALYVNYADAQFNALNRLLYPVPAQQEGWTGHRCWVGADHTGYFGIAFMDAINGSTQISIRCGPLGIIQVYRGTSRETLIASSAPGSFYNEEWFFLEAYVKVANTGGRVTVRVNTKVVIDLIDADTDESGRGEFDMVGFQGRTSSGSEGWIEKIKVDDWYYCDGDGSVNNGFLGNVRVKTQMVIADGTNIDFNIGGTQTMSTMGLRSDKTSLVFNTQASPYNLLNTFLRRVLAKDNTTITEIRMTPSASSTTNGNKPVLFADNAGEPGALIASGPESIAYSSGIEKVLPFTSPPSVTAGTYYWIGFVASATNTSVRPYQTYVTSNEGRAGLMNSYATPATISAVTVSPEAAFYAITSTPMENWEAVQNPDMGETSYVYSPTVGDYDLYDLDPNINAPYVHAIQARLGMRQDDATQRIAHAVVQIGSSGTPSEGQDFYLNQSFSIYRDIFELNPDTGVFYTGTEANDAQVGPKVDT